MNEKLTQVLKVDVTGRVWTPRERREAVLDEWERSGMAKPALPVIAEARGKNEDAALSASFYKLLHDGTRNMPAERFRRLHSPMTFVRKVQNIAGTQLADLCGYPASRNILKPAPPNLAFDVARAHLYARDGESGWQVLP